MEKLYEELSAMKIGKVKMDEPLALHTTIKIGGPADLFIEPDSIENLAKVMKFAADKQIPWTVIGRGSNLLVSDKGIRGVVIKLGKGMDHIEFKGTEIQVGGGYSFVVLATMASRNGLKGLEFAAGIPGSLGGAVYMNAGAHGSDISRILKKAHILFEDGSMEWLSNEEMEYSYRTSVLQNKRPGIVLEAVLELQEGNKDEIVRDIKEYKEYRRVTQPWSKPCCGSVFRNPLPDHAGKLIEDANLKGYKIGGAEISDMHGNFIVNTGGATAADVLGLIDYIKATILEQKGIHMQTEVEILGDF